MKKLFVILFALMLVITGAAAAQDTLTFGTNAEFPPFEFVTAEGVIDEYPDNYNTYNIYDDYTDFLTGEYSDLLFDPGDFDLFEIY